MSRIRHLLLDCDGVLVDSEPIAVEVEVALLNEMGVPASAELIEEHFVGKDVSAIAEIIRARFGMTLPADFENRHSQRMLEAFRGRLEAVAGLTDALSAIALPKSVVSNSVRDRVLFSIRSTGIAYHFADRVHTASDPGLRPKPWPDLYLRAAEHAGMPVAACLAVDDSPSGVRAAVAAGCRVLGFTGTARDPVLHSAKLRDAGAEATESDMARLPWWIDAFSRGLPGP
ncbi:MAG: HAD-IA family hydrolase [Hyphomicrobiaceae bacterium]